MNSPVQDWLDAHATTLKTLEPDAPFDDLEALAEMIGDARIVGLGESSHVVHEFYLMRDRILRFLVERLGFRAFVIESGWCEGLAVREWVRGNRDDDVRELVWTGMNYMMGSGEEFCAQLQWMRERTAAGTPVEFFGMDMIGNLVTPAPGLLPVQAYLERVDPEMAACFTAELEPLVASIVGEGQAVERYRALPRADRDRMTALADDLRHCFDDRRPDYEARSSATEYSHARRHVELVAQFFMLLRHFPVPNEAEPDALGDGRARGRFMAENLAWILDELGPDSRVVIAAHNGHLARQNLVGIVDGNRMTASAYGLGQYLQDRYGDTYRPIGFTHRTGTFEWRGPEFSFGDPVEGSLEHVLAPQAGPDRLVDLRQWPTGGPVAEALDSVDRMRLNELYCECTPRRAWDLLVHVDTVRMFDFVPAPDSVG